MDAANWLWLAVCAGLLAVVYGLFSMAAILRLDAGNARMQEIAAAIQAGAKAYLNRQYSTIAMVGAVLFVVLWWALGAATAGGFAVGRVIVFPSEVIVVHARNARRGGARVKPTAARQVFFTASSAAGIARAPTNPLAPALARFATASINGGTSARELSTIGPRCPATMEAGPI